ncbi:unnamed protein product [Dimorphilus gyrociliatus]|uniref:Uncharacterized protein n=1 Tax=Dimorphilus gyrociliatus TaxID=2664684 RepID=A0A7I8VV18_9ANNE|nr:unnamed protein product [Dimorphilus gyrociliatus]
MNRSSIQEANSHIEMLYERIRELEATLANQSEAMRDMQTEHEHQLQQLSSYKDTQISALQQHLDSSEHTVRKLMKKSKSRELEAQRREHALTSEFERILYYKPTLEKLVSTMNSLGERMNDKETECVQRGVSPTESHDDSGYPSDVVGSAKSDKELYF